ncbi:MAG: LysR family transcriptional regulator [Betaproteobacteria bacterium RIFCSPLOWO2_12_FULL_62_58]|nr:MAG: LysR family transcriptional regulator [Betaproteobacteria bacterium RIFCSPLOWO2_12_FULL_62_58]
MTLTELRYVLAVARERHFGRAAEKCFVSQPTLSVAIKKLEDELGVTLFERGASEVTVTPVGACIVEQAQRVLEETAAIEQIAAAGKDELVGPLRLGAIYTVGPYLMPQLIPLLHKRAPKMPLLIQENFTAKLAELLKNGELDLIILSLPFSEPGIVTQAVYDEPFRVVIPAGHPWVKKTKIPAADLCSENLLLLSSGNCFRDQVLQTCSGVKRSTNGGMQQTLEGSSLETIRHMVASGAGITVLPTTAAEAKAAQTGLVAVRPFAPPVPTRRIALAWRRSFPRPRAVAAVREAILACRLPGVTLIARAAPVAD